ncbi:hypothetical protein SDC9_149621 [bioreactor metagenome]|uniref:Uncharacterized protein n=1 Tax=bioreactor metagenome TaxID=1076179 RepID=A0A645EK44_9ZZZZ
MAAATAVEDQGVAEHRPIGGVEQLLKVGLDDLGFRRGRPAEAFRNPQYMGVGGDGGQPESMTSHHIGGLAPDTRQLHQVIDADRHLAVVVIGDLAAQPLQRRRLVAEEAGGPNDLFEFGPVGLSQRLRGRPAREKHRGDFVHPDIGRLGRQHRGDQQLERTREVELAARVRVGRAQQLEDFVRGGFHAASTTNSTSTAALAGSTATPTALRTWRPSSPKSSMSNSDAPLATSA